MNPTEKVKALETALALVLLLTLMSMGLSISVQVPILIVSLLALVWILPFSFLAKGWFALGHFLGLFVGSIILSIIYFGLICPLGFFYRLSSKNALNIFKAPSTLFIDRNYKFTLKDLDKPF